MSSLADELQGVADLEVRSDEPLSEHTSFRIGGPADILCAPSTIPALREALGVIAAHGAPLTVMGSGSNLLVRDGGVRGVVLKIAERMGRVERDGDRIAAEAGARLGAVARFAAEHSLSGLEFAAGIPGSIGGAVTMNAGAYGGEMADVVEHVDSFDRSGEAHRYSADELDLSYRHSALLGSEEIVARVEMRLRGGDADEIARRMSEFSRRRRRTQPLGIPSAGSVFKRPPGDYAGRLIDAAGLKGHTIGGAQVSETHAGFIVNIGGATARDVLALVDHIRDAVRGRFGVELETEIRIIGED